MILARVVFPTPGGPQKIREGKLVFWFLRRRLTIPFFPTKCSCPINSSRLLGLKISAKGLSISQLYNNF